MGWLFLFVYAALTFLSLWRSGMVNRTALEIAVVAILIGLAGYAWQGSPNLPEVPASIVSLTE